MSDHRTHRSCASCSAAPAAGNDANLCESYAKGAGTEQGAPPVLPVEFWERPEVRSALLSRHFGRFLRTYRTSQSPQVKQTQLATWLGITQGQLSRIERSSTSIRDLQKLDAWARILHVPEDLLWFTPRPPRPTHSTRHRVKLLWRCPRTMNIMKGATCADLLATTAGTGAQLLSGAPWQRLIDSVDKGRPVDTATVQLIPRLGDDTGALRAIERALTAFGFAHPRHERAWTAFFGASRLGSMTVSTLTTLHHRDATTAADSLLTSLSPTENKVRAIVLSDLTINAAQTNDYDRATTLVTDAIELTTRTETTLAKQRLPALATTLPPTSSPAAALRDEIMSTLRR